MSHYASRLRTASALSVVAILAGCGIDRDSSKALGQAGQTTTQALVDQETLAATRLGSIPVWNPVSETLLCSNHTPALQETCVKLVKQSAKTDAQDGTNADIGKIGTVIARRAAATQALRNAYAAFVDMATYDASAEAKASIQAAADSLDQLSTAVSAFAGPVPLIAGEVTVILGDVGGFVVGERQRVLLLQASKALHKACDTFAKDLSLERDFVTGRLMGVLQSHVSRAYVAFIQAGLVSPGEVLTPLLQTVAPGTAIVEKPPEANAQTIRAAALLYAEKNAEVAANQAVNSYDKAVAALNALSQQHQNLENGASIDTAGILALVQLLATDFRKPTTKPNS